MSIPSPRNDARSTRSSTSSHMRRPSIPISPTLSPRIVPVPIPQRHGSLASRSRPSVEVGSFGSVFSSSLPTGDPGSLLHNEEWLDTPVGEVLNHGKERCSVVSGDKGTEEAVDTLLKSGASCLLVELSNGYGFFDYSDLNSFLLLILQASGSASLDPRSHKIASSLRRGIKVTIGELCDLSQKSPYHSFNPSTPLRTLLPVFASGVHRVAINNSVLTETTLLHFLVTQNHIPDLSITHPSLGLALAAVVSLHGAASVLDAMQVMSLHGLGALGVTSGRHRSGSNSSGSSASSDPFDAVDLSSVITARDCTSLVVPSEGKQVLGKSLAQIVQGLQVGETAGQSRGEERFPVHTITSDTSLLHASHLILATSSSRVFVRRTIEPSSPPLSPLESPISLDHREVGDSLPGLPPPPSTQLSANQIVSISDVLASLAKRHHLKPHVVQADCDPASLGRRRRLSTLETSENMGLESWRWAR